MRKNAGGKEHARAFFSRAGGGGKKAGGGRGREREREREREKCLV
jgi:hypothetical protein